MRFLNMSIGISVIIFALVKYTYHARLEAAPAGCVNACIMAEEFASPDPGTTDFKGLIYDPAECSTCAYGGGCIGPGSDPSNCTPTFTNGNLYFYSSALPICGMTIGIRQGFVGGNIIGHYVLPNDICNP